MTIKQTLTTLALAGTLALGLTGCSDPTGEKDFEKVFKGKDANGLQYDANIYGRSFTDGQKPQIHRFDVRFSPDSNTYVRATSASVAEERTNNVNYARTSNLFVTITDEKEEKLNYFVSLTPSNTIRGVEHNEKGQILGRTYWGNSLPLPFDVRNLTQRTEDIVLETYAKGRQRQ